LVQRVLSRFLAQGYGAHDLSRVSMVPSDRDHVVRVTAFARRVSLFGRGATRLHDALLSVAAQWLENRGEGHRWPFAAAETRALTQLSEIFAGGKTLAPVPSRS
jgi:hypothetical protein